MFSRKIWNDSNLNKIKYVYITLVLIFENIVLNLIYSIDRVDMRWGE
jgi:hypothetical protein